MAVQNLKDKKILLCVTGSIAAYKAVVLLRLFIRAGAQVKVILTKAATDFISPLTFSTLSKNKVLTDLFDNDTWANHVMLGRWADVMIVAPCSCNTLAKMANGLCDNLLTASYFSATCPVIIAPAMDEDMWLHAATQKNVAVLKSFQNIFIPVNRGELASGLEGEGRMAEPEEIVKFIGDFFLEQKTLRGISALVTGGPTYEAIDPVRFIGNLSTGTMGISLAKELALRGAGVTLIIGPVENQDVGSINTIHVHTAKEMYESVMANMDKADIIIMAAAVADYTIENPSNQKIKKNNNELTLQLTRTKDILLEAGKMKRSNQTLVGFALETSNERENALKKLNGKNADLIVLNSLNDKGAGFGRGTNKIVIFDKKGAEYRFDKKAKKEVATDIINTIIAYRNA